MRNLVVNAPIQNKGFSPDVNLGKVIPIFASQHLRLETAPDGYLQEPVELWNNVLADQQGVLDAEAYSALTDMRLKDKYNSKILKELHDGGDEPIVMTDDMPNFTSWALDRIERSLSDGDISIKKLGVWACSGCDATLAISDGPKPDCISCPVETEVEKEERVVLVGQLSTETTKAVSTATDLSRYSLQTHNGYFVVNKRRVTGIRLGSLGFEHDVVDPRIGLGLLVLHAAEVFAADKVDVVASRSTMSQNLEHFYAAILSQRSELPELRMIGISKAPADYLQFLLSENTLDITELASILKSRIVPRLFSMHKDMSPALAEQMIFSRRRI